MNRKKFLTGTVAALILVGMVGASIPFISSLSPNAKADAALLRIDVSAILPGKPVWYSSPRIGEHAWFENPSLLIYKKYNGELRVWVVPTRDNLVVMPYARWWEAYFPCADFGPSFVDGAVDERKPIKCHRPDPSADWMPDHEWDIDGKAITRGVADMFEVTGVVEGKYFVLGKQKE